LIDPLNSVEDDIMSHQHNCFAVTPKDIYCTPCKRRRVGMDLTALSPLLLQFLAWNDFCRVEKELHDAQAYLTDDKYAAVIEAQKEFAQKAVETRHINPITPNYVVTPPSGTRNGTNMHVHDWRRRRGASNSSSANSSNTTHSTSTAKTGPTVVTLPPLGKSEYVPGSDEPFKQNVPQDSHYAQIVGFESHTVMYELKTPTTIVGRVTTVSKPDLDLSPVVRCPKKVSHSHLAIEWSAEKKQFQVRMISSNGAFIDGKLVKQGTVDISNGTVIRVQNFEMTLVIPKDMIPPQ